MSGILLPGQENRPDSSSGSQPTSSGDSGLILPGSAKRRPAPQPESPAPVPSESSAGAAPPAGVPAAGAPEGGPRRRLSAEDLAFPPQGAQVQCPSCGNTIVAPVFSIIDLGANPELKEMLLGSQINVATCQRCGYSAMLSAPLMVHVPDKQWLGVVIPPEARVDELQSQRIIGELSQALMRKLPQEQRKGYMLQPRQYADWNRFMEQMWEFEGVSAETIRRQRAQAELLQSLSALANDREALKLALARSSDLVDRNLFGLLDRIYLMLISQPSQASEQEIAQISQLREALLELTPAGQEIAALQERVRELVEEFQPGHSRDEMLQKLLTTMDEQDGREIISAVTLTLAPVFDYQFMLDLAERIDASTDEGQRKKLEDLRTMLLAAQERMQQTAQMAAQEASQFLQELLQQDDIEAALRANADSLDETFLAVLSGSIQQAEKNKSGAAARRLRKVYDLAVQILQDGLPPEMQLLNVLLSASENRADLKRLLEQNRELLTPEFISGLRNVEKEMRGEGREALADRVKAIRSQASLML
jgi:hypothetical protein